MRLKGITILEMLVVIVIVGILLSMTLYIGWDYLKTMEIKTQKEYLTSAYDTTLATARTSNYYESQEYEYITITLTGSGLTAQTDTAQTVEDLELDKTLLDFGSGAAPVFTVEPYSIGCSINVGTGVDFSLISTINNDVYCFSVYEDTCKLQQVSCN